MTTHGRASDGKPFSTFDPYWVLHLQIENQPELDKLTGGGREALSYQDLDQLITRRVRPQEK